MVLIDEILCAKKAFAVNLESSALHTLDSMISPAGPSLHRSRQ